MKLHLATASGLNLFTGYGDGYVQVNGVRYEQSLVVAPDRLIENWDVAGIDGLTPAHFTVLAGLGAEIVLLGTGRRLRFPAPALQKQLLAAGIGLEVMDSNAACRTFNILTAEGRKVIAAILLD